MAKQSSLDSDRLFCDSRRVPSSKDDDGHSIDIKGNDLTAELAKRYGLDRSIKTEEASQRMLQKTIKNLSVEPLPKKQ